MNRIKRMTRSTEARAASTQPFPASDIAPNGETLFPKPKFDVFLVQVFFLPLASLFLLQLSVSPLEAQWTSISIDSANGSPFRCWRKPDGTVVDEVVHIDHVVNQQGIEKPWVFRDQNVANVHLQVDSAGNTWLLGQGGVLNTVNLTKDAVGDSITLLKRNPDGTYDTNPKPDSDTGGPLVLHFPPISAGPTPPRDPLCPPSPPLGEPENCNWSFKGGHGAGSGFAQTVVSTPAGYRYFAIVVVSFYNGYQYGHPTSSTDRKQHPDGCAQPNTPSASKGWITWAVSTNARDWFFVAQAGGTTLDPAASIRLVARSDQQLASLNPNPPTDDKCSTHYQPPGLGAKWGDRFQHVALFYNKYDNYFYLLFGWASGTGLRTTWWRMLFNPTDTYGLGPLQMLTNGTPPTPYTPKFVPATTCSNPQDGPIRACIPLTDGWEVAAQYPNTQQVGNDLMPVDPMDVMQLYLCTQNCPAPLYATTFDSIIFLYAKTADVAQQICPTVTTFVKGTSPVFPFFASAPTPQTLNTSVLGDWINSSCYSAPVASVRYTALSASGGFFPALRQIGQQNDGAPKVTGYLSARRMDLHPLPGPCQGSGAFWDGVLGMLPADFVLGGSGVYPNISSVSPRGGPASGGTALTINGVGFQAPASVRVAGVPATNVVVTSTQITATTAAMVAGTLGDVAVTNTANQQVGTLPEGFLTNFTDVPASHQYYTAIGTLTRDHISKGCGGGAFCPTTSVTRDQMSLFLLKSKYPTFAYFPIPAVGLFSDVPPTHPFAPWIEELYRQGITTGCGGNSFCPATTVTRGAMAKFLLAAKFGSGYTPPACSSATFVDVPCSAQFSSWIYDATSRSFMLGCGGSNFCPNAAVQRQVMARDLTVTFNLP